MKKNNVAYKYLCYCIEGGIQFKCLFVNSSFEKFKTSSFYQLLYAQRTTLWKKYITRINVKINLELSHRYKIEQEAKNIGGETYYQVIDNNVAWIEQCLNLQIYPGEQIAGLMNSISQDITIKANNECEFASAMANVSLRHFNYGYDLLRNKLTKAMYAGEINPREVVEIFIFSKYRICKYRKEKPVYITTYIENTSEKNIIFNLPFEKAKTDIASANRNRYEWFIPRCDTKLNSQSLIKKYGITIMIGDWIGD
ncbi:MAG: hypothetical protein H0X33_09760 [Taibaiella sp.]|nr:hypothetical protein [Taibaiella sp.]